MTEYLTYMHLLQTRPNSIANSSISRVDDGFGWDSDDFDFVSSLSSSSWLLSSLSFKGIVSSKFGFFFLRLSSSSFNVVVVVVVGFKRFGGGGFEFVDAGAERFFYKK